MLCASTCSDLDCSFDQIKKPFPFLPVSEFQPSWIKTVKGDKAKDAPAVKLDMPTFFASLEALALAYHAVGVSPLRLGLDV